MGLLDSLLGKKSAEAANAAAADTYKKQQSAISDIRLAGDQYASGYSNLASRFNPYAEAGSNALSRLMAGLGLGGDGADFTAAYRATPGYQAGMDAGLDALDRRAASRGMLASGNTNLDTIRYASDYEDQRAQQYLANLAGAVSGGQTAAGQQVATIGQGLQGQLGANTAAYAGQMQSAGTVGQGMVAGAQAEQAGLQNLLNTGAWLTGTLLPSYWKKS